MMKAAAILLIAAGLGLFAWLLTRLSSDAIGIVLGLCFGVLACLPIMLVANARCAIVGFANSAGEHYHDGRRAGQQEAADQIHQLRAELHAARRQLAHAQRQQITTEWVDAETWVSRETRPS